MISEDITPPVKGYAFYGFPDFDKLLVYKV
jgi:hypothetical protein